MKPAPVTCTAVALFIVTALASGCGEDPVARVAHTEGAVERDHAKREERWEPAADGAKVHMGDGVRTGRDGRATLRMSDGSQLQLTSRTRIRFLSREPGSDLPGVHVEEGEAVVEAAADLRLRTRFGVAVIEGGTRLVMRAEGDGVRYDVEVGSAYLERDGARHPLSKEGGLTVSIGGVILEADHEGQPAADDRGEPGADAPPPTANPQTRVTARPADTPALRPHVQVTAGESFTVRDAQAPTHVGFRFGDACPEEAVVTVSSPRGRDTKARGRGSATVRLRPGIHRYEVRCVNDAGEVVRKPVAEGTARVMRDGGRAPLPRTPPTTLLDADGRRYTVLYQNLLPEVVVRWGRAPKKGALDLVVTSGGRSRTVPTGGGRHVFKSGELREGRHVIQFRARQGEARSPATTLLIGFDNAASTVSLRSPTDKSFAPGDTVAVAGVALPGWKVHAGGAALHVDGHGRFSGEVRVPPHHDGLALRLSHPRRGVQYYVRHAGGQS
jgi:hypothetical protein